MNLINGYNEGADITVLNTSYVYPKRDLETGKYDDGKMIILYKDNVTGKKKIQEINNPDYIYYKANDETYIDSHLLFIEEDRVHPVVVPYKDLLKKIAEDSGNLDFYYENIKKGDRRANEIMHTLPNIFLSDMNIEDAYKLYFSESYTNKVIPVSKAYFDIETDTIDMKGDFPEMGECPINAVSLVNVSSNQVFVFLLRDENNPQIEEFEREAHTAELQKELKDFIINHVGGYKYADKKHKIADFNYNFYFYDQEIALIADIFKAINILEPDFLLAWNMAFDVPYIIERIKALGYNPEDIMCHPEAITKIAKYYIDIRNKQMPAQKGDYYTISGKTIYLDQLVHFASRRKGQSAFDNLKLDYIGKVIAGIGKLDWSPIAKTFADFIRKNYKLFVFYNIMDTLVQHCVENKVNDIDYVFNKCLMNNTRYNKCHRQTIYLVNRGIKEFKKDGFIMGNNNNRNNEKPPKFPGALVGDPTHNNNYSKMQINGEYVNLANNLDDFDFKSLYPSTMREFNIAPNTQIGKIIIDEPVFDGENPFNYSKFSRSGQFLEDYQSNNYIEFSKRWFHLAGYKEFIHDMKEFFEIHKPYGTMNPTLDNELVRFYDIPQVFNLVEFNTCLQCDPLVQFYPEKKEFKEELEYIRKNAQMDINNIEEALKRRQREIEEDEELEKMFTEEEKPATDEDGGEEE